jgi:hypothetical protein
MGDIQTDTMVADPGLFDTSDHHPNSPGNSYMQLKFRVYHFL